MHQMTDDGHNRLTSSTARGIGSPFIGGVTCLNASRIYQAEGQYHAAARDPMADIRSSLVMCVNSLTKMHELFEDCKAACYDSLLKFQARCLYSMHTHFLDTQRSPPRKRPLLYPIHVCTCNNAR